MKHLRIPVLLFAVGLACAPGAEKPGWTSYTDDHKVKARGESEFKDNKLIKTDVFDAGNQLLFIEYPVYGEDGNVSGIKRTLPDGTPWPYAFPVYGVFPGGISKVAEDIKEIQRALPATSDPVLEMVFLAGDHVEVSTGVVKGPLNGRGRYRNFKKIEGKWGSSDKGAGRSWVS